MSDWLQFKKMSLIVSSDSYCTSAIVGSRVYGNTLAALFTHYPIVRTMKHSAVGIRVLARVTSTGYYST